MRNSLAFTSGCCDMTTGYGPLIWDTREECSIHYASKKGMVRVRAHAS